MITVNRCSKCILIHGYVHIVNIFRAQYYNIVIRTLYCDQGKHDTSVRTSANVMEHGRLSSSWLNLSPLPSEYKSFETIINYFLCSNNFANQLCCSRKTRFPPRKDWKQGWKYQQCCRKNNLDVYGWLILKRIMWMSNNFSNFNGIYVYV